MAIEAVNEMNESDLRVKRYLLKDVSVLRAIQLRNEEKTETQFLLSAPQQSSQDSQKWYRFQLHARESNVWSECCSGSVAIEFLESEDKLQSPRDLADVARHSKQIHDLHESGLNKFGAEEIYEKFSGTGFGYGPLFRTLQDLIVNERGQATAKVKRTPEKLLPAKHSLRAKILHPTTLDGIFQLVLPA